MTQIEIYETIQRNNARIREAMNPNVFTLNNLVAELLAENKALQEVCKHNYVDNYCEYCMKNKETE